MMFTFSFYLDTLYFIKSLISINKQKKAVVTSPHNVFLLINIFALSLDIDKLNAVKLSSINSKLTKNH